MARITIQSLYAIIETNAGRLNKGKMKAVYNIGQALCQAKANLAKADYATFQSLIRSLHTLKNSEQGKYVRFFQAIDKFVELDKANGTVFFDSMDALKVSYSTLEELTKVNAEAFKTILEGRETYFGTLKSPLTSDEATAIVYMIQKEGKTVPQAFTELPLFKERRKEERKAEKAKKEGEQSTADAETLSAFNKAQRALEIFSAILGDDYAMEGKTDEDIVQDILTALVDKEIEKEEIPA